MIRHLLSIRDLNRGDVERIFGLSAQLKAKQKRGEPHPLLSGKSIALIFEKPSLRTRVTFEVGLRQLGGHAVYLAPGDIQLGGRETVADVARNLSRWTDGVVARTFRHEQVEELARYASVPVVNGLSDWEHPCQALADYFTLWERGYDLAKVRVAYVGDGNNVCHSLILLSALLGGYLSVACPEGYDPDPRVIEHAHGLGGHVEIHRDPRQVARNADVLYTDVWTSMGQEEEREQRLRDFQGYQVNRALVNEAAPGALVMHCLPAHRGEEISGEVIDGPSSVVFDQAENRLHAQKGVLVMLMGGPP